MIAATKEAGVQFAVGQVVRFWPELYKSRSKLRTFWGQKRFWLFPVMSVAIL